MGDGTHEHIVRTSPYTAPEHFVNFLGKSEGLCRCFELSELPLRAVTSSLSCREVHPDLIPLRNRSLSGLD